MSQIQPINSNANSLSIKFPNPVQEYAVFASQGKQNVPACTGIRINYPSDAEDAPVKMRKVEVRFST